MFLIYGKNTITGERFDVGTYSSFDEVITRIFHLIRQNPDCVYKWRDIDDSV